MSEFLNWSHKATDIPSAGLEREREAEEVERQAAAAALGLLKLRRLQAAYRIEHAAGGAYRLRGRLAADLDQACVITLEPVTDRIETPFDVEFWPQLEAPDSEDEASVLSGPDVELLEAGTIPVGRIVFETSGGVARPLSASRERRVYVAGSARGRA